MKIFDQLHAFMWESMTANNCNTYFIDGLTRVLIDPGHLNLFSHVKTGLANIGVGRTDLPGGNGELLKKSIKRLADLEIEWVLPGHGEIISGIEAVKANFNEIENYWFKYI